MRKLLLLPFILITLTAFGQQQATFAPPPPPVFIVTVQMGTDTVRNGVDTVRLTDGTIEEMNEGAADTNYAVTLTPIGDCGPLSFVKSNRFYFIIKQQGGAAPKAAFDYVVFSKQPRPWMPLQPHRPPAGH